ncbi:hypothetical protein U1Q18_033418 [Sarracenia purpurea var. burkii]
MESQKEGKNSSLADASSAKYDTQVGPPTCTMRKSTYTNTIYICRTCEICGATALNVVGEQINEGNGTTGSADATAGAGAGPVIHVETRSFWHGHRVMNILLACMVFAFVISWLFHFNVIS